MTFPALQPLNVPAVNVPLSIIVLNPVAAVLFAILLNAVATSAAVAPPDPAVNVKPQTVIDSLAARDLNASWLDSVTSLAPSVFVSSILVV